MYQLSDICISSYIRLKCKGPSELIRLNIKSKQIKYLLHEDFISEDEVWQYKF